MAGGKPVPTIEMVGPAGRIVCNLTDRAHYESRGYTVPGDAPVHPVASLIVDLETEDDEEDDEEVRATAGATSTAKRLGVELVDVAEWMDEDRPVEKRDVQAFVNR